MAQTNYTPIQLYYSSTASAVPVNTNLASGELAINITDGLLFYKDNAGTVQKIGYKLTPTTAGGTGLTSFTANGIVYASSTSALATGSALTFDGTTFTAGTATGQNGVFKTVIGSGGANEGVVIVSGTTGTGWLGFNNGNNANIPGQVTYNHSTGALSLYANAGPVIFSASGAEGMRLTSTGLGIGTSSPTNALSVSGNANITGNTTLGDASTDTVTVNGYMGVGGAGSVSAKIVLAATQTTTGSVQYGINGAPVFGSDATSVGAVYSAQPRTSAASYTINQAIGYRAIDVVQGAGSTITSQYGVYIEDQTKGTNNYGITSEVSSGSNKWNIYASGTAANYFAGNVGIGTSSPAYKLDVNGTARFNNTFDFGAGQSITSGSGSYRAAKFGAASGAYNVLFSGSTALSINDNADTTNLLVLTNGGNLGLGVTPSAWTNYTGSQVGALGGLNLGGSVDDSFVGSNVYYNVGYKFARPTTATYATMYRQTGGVHSWQTSTATGTAGNAITFTQAMTLNASGNLGIGTTSPAALKRLHVANVAAGSGMRVSGPTSDNNWAGGIEFYSDNATTTTSNILVSSGGMQFGYGGSERMRIDSSGNLGIGTTNIQERLTVQNNIQITNNASNLSGIYFGTNANPAQRFSYIESDGRSTGYINFNTNALERMRIDSGGKLLLGVTSGTGLSNGDFAMGNGNHIRFRNAANSAYISAFEFTSANGLNIGTGGSLSTITFGISGIGEAGRFDTSGNLLVGTTSSTKHVLRKDNNNNEATQFENSNTSSPYVSLFFMSGASPNNSTNYFWTCVDGGFTTRATIRSNGGLANYSGNNVNLSDRREKTNFAPAGDYLAKICAIPVQTFNYIDQNLEEDDGLTLGVVAQDVQAVAPELVLESNWAGKDEEPKMRLSIYQTDLQYALMKCIQEQQAIIQSLTDRITALEGA